MLFKKLLKKLRPGTEHEKPAGSSNEPSTVVVPEPEIVRHECKVDDFGRYDKFDLLYEDYKLGVVRIADENAKELARIKYLVRHRDAKCIYLAGELWKYLSGVEETERVARLFVTKNGGFFYQYIFPDGAVKYYTMDRTFLKRDMLKWQKFDKETKKPLLTSDDNPTARVLPPGVYDKAAAPACDCNRVNLYEWFVLDYEVVDVDAMKKALVDDF